MATLYIAEFSSIAAVGTADPQIVAMPPVAEQTVAIGATTANSSQFNAATRIIRLTPDSVCSIKVGPSTPTPPSAAVTNMRLAANAVEYFSVSPGYEVAVIANT